MSAIGGVLDAVEDVRSLSRGALRERPGPRTKVLVDPAFFDREYVVNPHMAGSVDRGRARAQWTRLKEVYERRADDVLEAPADESTDGLAVNVEVTDDTVVLGDDLPATASVLADAGFEVVSVDTSEFQKAGGSVCCLTLAAGTPA